MMSAISKTVRNVVQSVAMPALLAWERIESGVNYNPISKEIQRYPYDKYAQLRNKDPIHRLRLINGWVLTRYEDMEQVLKNHALFGRDTWNSAIEFKNMLFVDPPDHTRLRSLVSKAFTPRSVAALEPGIHRIVDDLLDVTMNHDRFDLISMFAYPLPVMVIAVMLGVPTEDIDLFKKWSHDIALSIEPILNEEQGSRIMEARKNLEDYFEHLIEHRQRDLKNDMTSALIAAEVEGDRLTHQELIDTLLLLLVAGHETTRNLIGNGMLALLSHPNQLQRLRDHSNLMVSAINEMLRYDSPVQLDSRQALQDVNIGSKKIKTGQRVLCLIGAANRDPAAFTNPDVFDIGRHEPNHLSFGRGIHYCLGAPLAILEARVAFSRMLERFSSIQLLHEPTFQERSVLRGVDALWIQVEHAAI